MAPDTGGNGRVLLLFVLLSQMRRQTHSRVRFVVCVKNKGYEASLERGKVYRMIPDAEAAKHGYVRIVDESGEDYGYSSERFIAIDLPKSLEKALFKPAS
jgi:hypothetical protein